MTKFILFYLFSILPLIFSKLHRITLTHQKAAYQRYHNKQTQKLSSSNHHFLARIRLLDYSSMQYSGYVKLGSSLSSFNVIFDTGSSYLWVASSQCSSCTTSGISNLFDCSASSTCETLGEEIAVTYGTGSLQGSLVEDTVQIGDYTAEDVIFIDVNEVTDFDSFAADGILGLGMASASSGMNILMDELKTQGQITNRIFSFYLGGKNDSYMPQFTLDGYDERLFQNGSNLTYCALTDHYYWGISVGYIYLNKTNKGQATTVFNATSNSIDEVIIDSGTSLFVVDTATFNAIYSYFESSSANCFMYIGYIFCSSLNYSDYPDIVTNLCGSDFTLAPEDYLEQYLDYYVVMIEGYDSGYLIFGDVFMRKFYTVFDLENNQIGFGVATRGGEAIDWDWAWGIKQVFDYGFFVIIWFFCLLI